MTDESKHRPGRYLAFQAGGRYFALPQDYIEEITPAQDLLPVAFGAVKQDAGFLGFIHRQSMRVPVYHLNARLTGVQSDPRITSKTRIVIINVHGTKAALYADRLTDMIQARAHEIRRHSITGHGRPKLIVAPESIWTAVELASHPRAQ